MRSYLIVVVLIVATLITAPLVILLAAIGGGKRIDSLIRWWARSIVRAAGIRLSLEGDTSLLRGDHKYVFVANHQSYLDVPCLLAALPIPIRFMAKKSLFQVPLFGWGLKAAGFIPIDRKNKRSAVQSLDLAAQRIRIGDSILVFPEEGRSHFGAMKPFQRGAFLLALKAELPVFPMAIIGMHEALPIGKFLIKPGPVRIQLGTPIPTAGLSVRSKTSLIESAHAQVGSMLYGSETEYRRRTDEKQVDAADERAISDLT